MYAVLGQVNIDASRDAEVEALLNDQVVPMAKERPGFISGTWARSADGTQGRSLTIFDSQANAEAAATAARQGPLPGGPVTVVSVDVMEVVAQA